MERHSIVNTDLYTILIWEERAVPLTVLSRWACEHEHVERIANGVRPILANYGADLRVGKFFSGRHTGQFLAAIRYPDWERLGRAMQAMATEVEYQKALVEADRLCELQSRSIVVDLNLGQAVNGRRSPGER